MRLALFLRTDVGADVGETGLFAPLFQLLRVEAQVFVAIIFEYGFVLVFGQG